MKHTSITQHTVSRETFSATDELIEQHRDELANYLDQLLWWNERINLISRNVSRETIWEHIRHSLLLSQLDVFKSSQNVMDGGTGGGLPGLPLAITNSEKKFTVNDIVTKKCLAVKQMVRKMGLSNIDILDGSIAKTQRDGPFLLISKHAFKINELFQMVSHLPWTKMVFYKGDDFSDEIKQLNKPVNIDAHHISEDSAFYKGKSIVIIERQ